MGKPTLTYDPSDIELAAFNKLISSPECMAIIGHLQERQDWTEESELTKLSSSPEEVEKNLKRLTAANILSRIEREGLILYRLDADYFKQISVQFNKLVDEMTNGRTNNNL